MDIAQQMKVGNIENKYPAIKLDSVSSRTMTGLKAPAMNSIISYPEPQEFPLTFLLNSQVPEEARD